MGHNGAGIIGALSAEGRGLVVNRAADKSLGDGYLPRLVRRGQIRTQGLVGQKSRELPIDLSLPVRTVRLNKLPCVKPQVADLLLVEVMAYDLGGDQLAARHDRIVLCIKGSPGCVLHEAAQGVEDVLNVLINLVCPRLEQPIHNLEMVLLQLLQLFGGIRCLVETGLVVGLQGIRALAHGGDHDDQIIIGKSAKDRRNVLDGLGILHGRTAEFEYSHSMHSRCLSGLTRNTMPGAPRKASHQETGSFCQTAWATCGL